MKLRNLRLAPYLALFLVFLGALLLGCSDFYNKDFVHVASAHNLSKEERAKKEREIQAMRKSQIIQDSQSRLVMIARYVNDYSKDLAKELIAHKSEQKKSDSGFGVGGEVFLIEVYDKHDEISPKDMRFVFANPFESVESRQVTKLSQKELEHIAQFVPDIAYNDVYLVLFDPISARGRESLRLEARVKNLGNMRFEFGYIVRKSKLVTQ